MEQSIKGAGSGEMGKHWGSSSWVMVFHGAGAEVAPGRGAGGSPSPLLQSETWRRRVSGSTAFLGKHQIILTFLFSFSNIKGVSFC